VDLEPLRVAVGMGIVWDVAIVPKGNLFPTRYVYLHT
jgi:hypothetical protein